MDSGTNSILFFFTFLVTQLLNYRIKLIEGRDFVYHGETSPSNVYCLFQIASEDLQSEYNLGSIDHPCRILFFLLIVVWNQVLTFSSPLADINIDVYG